MKNTSPTISPTPLTDEIKDQDARMMALIQQETFTERDVYIATAICRARIKTLEKLEKEIEVIRYIPVLGE